MRATRRGSIPDCGGLFNVTILTTAEPGIRRGLSIPDGREQRICKARRSGASCSWQERGGDYLIIVDSLLAKAAVIAPEHTS
jgi:hypothetical protein